ncbi:MAG: sensor histidine kinase [Pseudomonadota bacterium]
MTDGFWEGDIFRGLAFRILLFLSLALLPFGIIATVQTGEISRQAERTAELSLLGLTEQAARAERAAIQEAFGATAALSSIIGRYLDDPEECSNFLAAYRSRSAFYAHVGHLPVDGKMVCSSSGRSFDFSADDEFVRSIAHPARSVIAHPSGEMSGLPVLVLNHPFELDGAFAGYITLSLPLSLVRGMSRPVSKLKPYDLVTFNSDGGLLLSDRGISVSETDLPANRSLRAIGGEKTVVFRDENSEGDALVYAVVPIVEDVVYSMSIWRASDVLANTNQSRRLSIFLPVLMWLASLIVAFWSLNRLAIRHIRKLSRQMRQFAYNRAMPRSTLGKSVPRELKDMQQAFTGMAESIIRDEAALEDSLRDKNVLLKEVHHRVKNNLQLISSIMNMQIRRAQTEDAKLVLRRLQDRILSLATVHKNLYQNDALDRVNAGALLKENIGQLLRVGLAAGSDVEVTQHYDPVIMDADDAAPLTLLVSEAVTNALKYIGRDSVTGRAHLTIELRYISSDRAAFSVLNSTRAETGSEGTGLGSQLINAFARQLNAQVDVGYEDGEHMLKLTFPVNFRDRVPTDF